jgi:toxin ParE1/3/4
MRVRITPLAAADLDNIASWIAKDSPRRSLSFVGELVDRCRSLAEKAESYPVIGRFRGHDIRRRVHKGYLILYRVGIEIEVVRVLSGARDLDLLLDG